MSPLDQLLLRLDTLAWRLRRGELSGARDYRELTTTAQTLALDLGPAGRAQLLDRIANVRASAAEGARGLEERMLEAKRGQRAVRDYVRAAPARRGR